MNNLKSGVLGAFGCLAWVAASWAADTAAGSAPTRFGQIDARRLSQTDQDGDQWLTPGRDAAGTYYSPLDSINDGNAGRLGFAWDYQLGTSRGLQGTPIVVDGVMYASGNWGRVYA